MSETLVIEKCAELFAAGMFLLVGHAFILNQLIRMPRTGFGEDERSAKRIKGFAIMSFMEEAVCRFFPLRLVAQVTDDNGFALTLVAVICSLLFGWAHSGAVHVRLENLSVKFEPYGKSPLWKYLTFQGVGGLIFSVILLFGVYSVQLTWKQAFWVVVFVHFFGNIVFWLSRIYFRKENSSEVA